MGNKAIFIPLFSSSLIFCMEISFMDCYFKLSAPYGSAYDSNGKTVLMKAVTHNSRGVGVYPKGKQKEFITYLIKTRKLPVNALSRDLGGLAGGKSALWFAIDTGNSQGVKALVENGATDIKYYPGIACCIHAWKKRKEIKSVIPFGEIDASYLGIIKFLLSKGFSPDSRIGDQYFPLVTAYKSQQKFPGLLELLILHAGFQRVVVQLVHPEIGKLERYRQRVRENFKSIETDKTTYLSLLVPDIQRLVANYVFKSQEGDKVAAPAP